MQIIKKARSGIQKILGSQKKKEGCFRLMKYILTQETADGDELLLYNVITGELVKLQKEEKKLLEALPCTPSEEYNELVAGYYVVPQDYDEKKTVNQLRKILRTMEGKPAITGYTILPTTFCNARCFYCYECDYEHIHMTEETALKAVDYIEEHSKGKKVSIGWFGGEPLVGEKIISLISKELTDRGIEFTSSMISNGALFNEDMVKKAVELWKLKSIQITIDGTEDVYNEVKAYVNPQGSPYRRVLENIRLLSKAGIRVSIRINLGFHNEDDTEALIAELSEYFAAYENVSMYVHELFENEGVNPRAYTEEEKEHLTQKVIGLNDAIARKGKYISGKGLPSLTTHHCMADGDGSVIIQPDGGLSKCEHYAASDEFGSVYSDQRDDAKLAEWKTHAEIAMCETCPLYPSCLSPVRCPETGKCSRVKQDKDILDVKQSMLDAASKELETDNSDVEDTDEINENSKNC